MNRLFIIFFLATCVLFGTNISLEAGKCVGSDHCTACKTCRYCAHCAKDGGTCGVCKPRSIPKDKQSNK